MENPKTTKLIRDLKPNHDRVKLDECDRPLYVTRLEKDLMFGKVKVFMEDDWFTIADGDSSVPVY